MAGAVVIEIAQIPFWVRYSRRGAARAGPQTLIGKVAQVTEACRPTGRVWLDGETWRARCDQGADVGHHVTVRAIEGLTVVVEPDGP